MKKDITIKLTGMQAYWINLALEKLVIDEDNFVDEEDQKEAEELKDEFYRQWYPQDSSIPKTWQKPKAKK